MGVTYLLDTHILIWILGGSSRPSDGLLDWEHRDPFDRLLVAQASVEHFTLVTADRAMASAPGVTLLGWT